jgi:C-terminal processing protease CtpA/Prc
VFPDSQAALKTAVQPGDTITEIAGADATGLTYNEALQKIKEAGRPIGRDCPSSKLLSISIGLPR